MVQRSGILSIFALAQLAYADATSSTVSASATTTASDCNPLETSGCPADKALAGSFSEDFTSESKWFSDVGNPGNISYSSDGVSLTLAKRFDDPALKSNFYIMYGKVEVELKAAPGQGIVSSFFLQSDDLDEIDLEWVGSDNTQWQSNYFSKGNTTAYNRGAFQSVDAPVDEYHNYTLDWAMDQTVWYLDGTAQRTLANTSSEGYPQSPMCIKMGIWAGGDPDNAAGTIEWAGGEVDYSKAPFTMYIKRVIVTDYSTGTEYSYNGQSGSWESIEAEDGSVYGRYEQAQADFAELSGGEQISSSASVAISSTSSASSSTSTSSSTISSSSSSSNSDSSTSTSSASSSASSSPSSTSTSDSTSSTLTSSSTSLTSSASNSGSESSSVISSSTSTDAGTSAPVSESVEVSTTSGSSITASQKVSSTMSSESGSSSGSSAGTTTEAAAAVTSSTMNTQASSTNQQSSSSVSVQSSYNQGSTFALTRNWYGVLAIMGAALTF